MSQLPTDRQYTKEHEWIKIEGDIATVGITEFAQSELGDVTYVEVPKVGQQLSQGQAFGVVESVKAVSDIYTPVAWSRSTTPSPTSRRPSTPRPTTVPGW